MPPRGKEENMMCQWIPLDPWRDENPFGPNGPKNMTKRHEVNYGT